MDPVNLLFLLWIVGWFVFAQVGIWYKRNDGWRWEDAWFEPVMFGIIWPVFLLAMVFYAVMAAPRWIYERITDG